MDRANNRTDIKNKKVWKCRIFMRFHEEAILNEEINLQVSQKKFNG